MSTPIDNVPQAIRLARTIASDLLVYNREKVAAGLANDDVFERLEFELAEGQRHFDSRVTEQIREKANFLDRAVVDVLICGSTDCPAMRW